MLGAFTKQLHKWLLGKPISYIGGPLHGRTAKGVETPRRWVPLGTPNAWHLYRLTTLRLTKGTAFSAYVSQDLDSAAAVRMHERDLV